VSFTETRYSANESEGSIRVELELNTGIDQEISVQVALRQDSAIGINLFIMYFTLYVYNGIIGNGVDFDSTVRSVTFLPGAITSFTNIPITDDPIAEPTESFDMALSVPPSLLTSGLIIGFPSFAMGIIVDDDGMKIIICSKIYLLLAVG